MTIRLKRLALGAVAAIALAGCQTTSEIDTADATGGLANVSAEQRVSLAMAHYEAGNYGLAEKHYRLSVETTPKNPAAWLGLAAAYDQLGRFDLADRAYQELIRLEGRKAAILNNQGYSMILRGQMKDARKLISEARTKAPGNTIIEGNWKLVNAG